MKNKYEIAMDVYIEYMKRFECTPIYDTPEFDEWLDEKIEE